MQSKLIALAATAGSAAGLAGLYSRYRREMRELCDDIDAASQRVTTPLGVIEYGCHGHGEPVLVVHGAGGGFDQGLLIGDDLGPGYRIIAPSRFGYLAMPVPDDSSHAAQADAHAALLDALKVERAVIVGVSAGAPSAIEMALRHRDRVSALVLMVPRAFAPGAPEIRAPRESEAVLRAVMSGVDFPFWLATKVARGAVVRFLGVPPEVEAAAASHDRARVTEIMRRILPLSRRLAGLRNDGENGVRDWPLERITAPTLVISVADDLYHTMPAARHAAERIPDAETVLLKSGGHLLIGQGEVVRDRIRSFLQRRRAAPVAAAA
jgi:pimeloyl-ACP methyl ester carboxylesterase